MNEDGMRFEELWFRTVSRAAGYKMKKDECAKPGKYPRMIGDLGIPASLQGFVVSELLKKAQSSQPLHIHGGDIVFCSSPAREVLQDVFDQILNPRGRFFFVYFSDDSCLSLRIGTTVYIYNLDISGCDRSHKNALFEALLAVTPENGQKAMQTCIKQLRLPVKIRSMHHRKVKTVLQADETILFSGSTLTTVANNQASLQLGLAYSLVDFHPETIEEQITEAALSVGYVVTSFFCEKPEHVQFLKNSPCLDTTGVYRPLLNLGVCLRSAGRCKGDLPGRGDLKERARCFQAAFLQGCYPYVSFPMMDAFKSSVSMAPRTSAERLRSERTYAIATSLVARELEYKVASPSSKQVTPDVWRFTDDAVFARYTHNPRSLAHVHDFALLSETVATPGFQLQFRNPAVDAILNLDYDL